MAWELIVTESMPMKQSCMVDVRVNVVYKHWWETICDAVMHKFSCILFSRSPRRNSVEDSLGLIVTKKNEVTPV